jgi:hypothetical protein
MLDAKFEVLVAVLMKIYVSLDVKPCREIILLHLQCKEIQEFTVVRKLQQI